MIARLFDQLARNPPKEIEALIKLIGLAGQDEAYKDLVHKALKEFPEFQARLKFLEAGYFREFDFLQLLASCDDGEGGTAYDLVMPALNRLIDWGLVVDQSFVGNDAFVRYMWNKKRINSFADLQIIDNVLMGPAYIAQKYRSSVPAVIVKKNEDIFTGTCFLATSEFSGKHVLVAAKHNVDPKDEITFLELSEPSGAKYSLLAPDWVLHPSLDIATMPVEFTNSPTPIFPLGAPTVLTRTITLGYPRIATADEPYVLAHGGELNANISTYYGEDRLIISNVVAPGNSGGPVLDEAGLCVGMVVNAFEAAHEGGVDKANSAIPADRIVEFIAPYCQ